MIFPIPYSEILERIQRVDPIHYARSRNFLDGGVSYLSPYISRGVISTKQVLESVLSSGYEPTAIEKFIQELAWRDYWQQIWINNTTLAEKHSISQAMDDYRIGVPESIVKHQTGIEAIDHGIQQLYQTGYMHNHMRMYVASIACNVSKCHWRHPAQWMYYHLLDADWASNGLSWQWVSGVNSSKQYYANQENINKYCGTQQTGSYLDIAYEAFSRLKIPTELHSIVSIQYDTPLPSTEPAKINPDLPSLVYNFYNLDPNWRADLPANRILLLEPSVFEKHPVSQKSIDFCIKLGRQNIPGIQVWVAEFSELQSATQREIYFKEHPLNNYKGIEDGRTWMSSIKGEYSSFFSFWKRAKKELF
jgi:deoxyribodipyrimidine photo-lyase